MVRDVTVEAETVPVFLQKLPQLLLAGELVMLLQHHGLLISAAVLRQLSRETLTKGLLTAVDAGQELSKISFHQLAPRNAPTSSAEPNASTKMTGTTLPCALSSLYLSPAENLSLEKRYSAILIWAQAKLAACSVHKDNNAPCF